MYRSDVSVQHPVGAVDVSDLAEDPIEELRRWHDEARAAVPQPDAMTLATVDGAGRPSARIVLARGVDERGITFFTNRTSRKGGELQQNPTAAAVFHWWELGRQVRIEGVVEETSEDESIEYWASRPRGSQLAAWASPQSAPLAKRQELDARVAEVAERFAGRDVPLPPFWGGYRLRPDRIEFWMHREDRLHDRVEYVRDADRWVRRRLAP
jgi:pyridoxamine 5'-phosphate oxidase